MNQTKGLIFGVLGIAAFGTYKVYCLHKKIEVLEEIIVLMTDVMELDFQKEIDEKFEEIAEKFEK